MSRPTSTSGNSLRATRFNRLLCMKLRKGSTEKNLKKPHERKYYRTQPSTLHLPLSMNNRNSQLPLLNPYITLVPNTSDGVPMKTCKFRVLLLAIQLLAFSAADAQSASDSLSESDKMRRCPVESSSPIPTHTLRAATATQGNITTKNVLTVPLHVHILQDSRGSNPVSTEIINASVSRLNSGFSRAGFTFQLQSVETVVNDAWARITKSNRSVIDDISASLNVGARNSANVYIGLFEGLCGLASLPYAEDPYEALFLDYRCIPGGSQSDSYDTIIHEMGHFMGLLHTFAPEPNGCRGKGDYVSDTPSQKVPHFKCRRYDTCPNKPGLDPVRNYMDYTEDACNHRFTRGQIALMRYAHSYYRLR